MANKISICNNALNRLGANSITTFADGSKAANLCNVFYEQERKTMLRTFLWNFAVKRVVLSNNGNTPEFGLAYEFDVPTDCLRTWKLENPYVIWKEENGKILSSMEEIELYYIYDVDDVDSMSETFKNALEYKLASTLSYPLIQSSTIQSTMYSLYKEEIKDMRTVESQIGTPESANDNLWVDSRRTPGASSGRREYYW